MAGQRTKLQVKIPSGGALSGEIDLSQYRVVGLQVPAAWTAAALTFQHRATGQTLQDGSTPNFGELFDEAGNVVTVASANVVADRTIMFVTDLVARSLAGVRHLKIRSGTSATPVNQAADRLLVLICEPIGV